jgi:hypothetical protein
MDHRTAEKVIPAQLTLRRDARAVSVPEGTKQQDGLSYQIPATLTSDPKISRMVTKAINGQRMLDPIGW